MDEPTTIIKAVTTAEIVALTEVSCGLELRACLAVLPFWDKRSSGAFRTAFPPLRDVDEVPSVVARLAPNLISTLARLDCDGVTLVAYTDDPFVIAEHPLIELLAGLMERLADAGYGTKDAAIVAGDAWCGYFEQAGERDLAELDAARAAIPAELHHRRAPERLPARNTELAEQVTLALLDRLIDDGESDAFGVVRSSAPPDPIDLLEDLLARDPDTVGPLSLARLLSTMLTEGDVDRTVLQIAFGRAVADASWQVTLATRQRAAEAGVQPFEIRREDMESGRMPADELRRARMLVGDTPTIPDPDRLHRGAHLLGRAIVHCGLPERSWAMCALAWVRWAAGIASAADTLVREAARIDPTNALAPVYAAVLHSTYPAWIFDRRPPQNRRSRRAASRAARRNALVGALGRLGE
ncbi:hypothetical protein [Microbacterium aurum]|uniref:hypothetical protein n=1 Tax=Microbacterium aurum TaxID=36805 RepID=UPI0028EF1A31|nr:hypothetical protein [Microbacterium aurum]